jgi:RluA family pseudouridine synthase
LKYNTIYEDEYVIAVEKPAGMLTVGDRYDTNSVHLRGLLKQKYGEIFVVHRIDKDTSGLILFAKDAESHRQLSMDFESHEVEKVYLAIVNGNPPSEGEINESLAESVHKPGTMTVVRKGKESFTKYKVIEQFQLFSLLEIEILTGRMHQIRVHMAYVGHPLFIDPIYGQRDHFLLSEIKGRRFRLGKYEEEERPLISRLSLHAHKLSFNHPVTKERIHLTSPIPKDFKALINQTKKMQF